MQSMEGIALPKSPLQIFMQIPHMTCMTWQKPFNFIKIVPKTRMNLTHFQCTGLGLYTSKVKVLKKISN